jgi:hypothetical protein
MKAPAKTRPDAGLKFVPVRVVRGSKPKKAPDFHPELF